jgi:putative MATE family efflux protein
MSLSNIRRKKLPLDLKNKTFWKLTLALAIPIALQNMLISSFSLVDTLMVSQLGDIELAATGMAGQWSWLYNMVLFGISSGAAVFVSQYWGDKNIKGINRTTGIAISAGLITSLVFLLLGLLIPDKIIYIFNQNPEVIKHGAVYLRYACLSYPALALTNILGSVLRSAEQPKIPTLVSGISSVANVILNYVLIFPAGLGVKGAAIATAISAWLGPILIISISAARKNILYAPLRDIFSFNRKTLAEFFKKALPVIANESMWGLGTVAYNIIFANIGHEEYAAITVVKTFENFAFCFFLGLGNACCVLVGKSIGAGEIRQGIRDSKRFMAIFPIISLIIGGAIILLRVPLVSIFNLGSNISEYTIKTAEQILIIYGAWITVRNIPYLTVVGIFRPGGDTTFGMIIEVAALWCFSVPMTFIAANVLNLPFLWVYAIMYLCEDLPKSLIFIPYWLSGKWIKPVTDAGRSGLVIFKSDE